MNEYKSKPITMSQPLFVSISNYKDVDRLDIRHYNHPEDGGSDLYPTKKGVSVRLDQAVALIDGIISATNVHERKPILEIGWATIYAGLDEYKGKTYFDVRNWWQPKGKRGLQPTDKGISVPAELVPALLDVLNEVRALIVVGQASAPITVDLAEAVSAGSAFSNFEVD